MGRLPNYLRTYRRQRRLTQEELAFIFGYLDQSQIGRLERDERPITLAVAHTCHLIFGIEPREVFPAFFAGVEENVYRRIHELQECLNEGAPTQPTLAKLEVLYEAIHRIGMLRDGDKHGES